MAFNRLQVMRDNIEAIRMAFSLGVKGRGAQTAEEIAVLRKYAGFGGLKCILNDADELADAAKWSKSDIELFAPTVELRRLIHDYSHNDREFKDYMDSLKASVLTAFYTDNRIVDAISDALKYSGIEIKSFLEPSAGQGAFIDSFLCNDRYPSVEVLAYEKDLLTGKIMSALHPSVLTRIEGFEKIERDFNGYFDVAASNVPFGDFAVADPEYAVSKEIAYRQATKSIHNYFFLKTLDQVREGGLVAFIASQGVMNVASPFVRMELVKRADLVAALRLPNNTFSDNAGTDVGSDLIILQKHTGKKSLSADEEFFIQSVVDRGTKVPGNKFFHLNQLGYQPTGRDSKGLWFYSPCRSERKPSFHVNPRKGVWFDFGSGAGGDIFTLAGELCNSTDFIRQAEFIAEKMQMPVPKPYKPVPFIEQPTFENVRVSKLESSALLKYLADRGIPRNIARRWCVQVDYRLHGKDYYAIGFENNAHGFELRSSFFKGSYPPKHITHIANGNARCNVFEGFIDFLSAERLGLNDGFDSVVLNSVANVGKALTVLPDYSVIACYLDNDEAGRAAFARLRRELGDKVMDKSALYPDHKDLNEFLVATQPKISNNSKLKL